MHSRCSPRLSPSSVNPAFHLALGDLSAYGSLMISISCQRGIMHTYCTHTGEPTSFPLLPYHRKSKQYLQRRTLAAGTDQDLGVLRYTVTLLKVIAAQGGKGSSGEKAFQIQNSDLCKQNICFLVASLTRACWACLYSQIIKNES